MDTKELISLLKICFIITLLFLTILIPNLVLAEEMISQQYQFNSNNWRGYIDISIDERGKLSGKGLIHTDPQGRSTKQRFWFDDTQVNYFGNNNIRIKFQRSGSDQVYHGWFSLDRRLIAGYFEGVRAGEQSPWYAIRE